MTLDDLMDVYFSAGATGDLCTRAGIRAVVEALRDATWSLDLAGHGPFWDGLLEDATCKKSLQVVKDRLTTEILAAAPAYHGAVPQVPNGTCREMTVGYTPAAAPVCEWKGFYSDGLFKWSITCSNMEVMRQRYDEERGPCGYCGKPISFKEGSE